MKEGRVSDPLFLYADSADLGMLSAGRFVNGHFLRPLYLSMQPDVIS